MLIRAIDLFCGAGGSSWGAAQAGVEVVCGIDAWGKATEVYSANFTNKGKTLFISKDTKPRKILESKSFDLALISPECTNHTCARGSRPIDEESRLTAKHSLQFLKTFKPRWAIIENVIQMRSWDRYKEILDYLTLELKYQITEQVLDAADFGVPQTRKRLFIMCDRKETPPLLIIDKNKTPVAARTILDPPGTWDTSPLYKTGRAPKTLERAERAIAQLPEDEDFLIVYYGSDAAGGWQRLDRPLRTLTTLDRFGLVERNNGNPTLRMLQVPELRRAMGFSDAYLLNSGTRREQVKMLGNGVCPPVMEAIVRSLCKIK